MVISQQTRSEFAQDKSNDPIVKAEIDNFEKEALAWRAGGGLGDDFRPFRLQHGTYGQRQANRQMMRIKVPHGTMTPEQLHAIAECADLYTPRKLGHVTTRQAIQIHFVMLEDAPKVMRRLAEVGITTREACGNTVRNITADPLSGIADDCVFDVTPYAEAAMRYFLRNPVNQKLPRKFKIAFSASPADRGFIPIHDIGFMAVERDGQQGFRVSVGGGLGAAPRVADVLDEFVPTEEMLRTTEATIRVWDRLGERRNKNKARIKFLVAKLGIDEFRRLYEAELATLPPASDEQWREPDTTLLEDVPAEGSWTSRNGPAELREGFDVWNRTNTIRQAQQGYRTVYVVLPIGDADATQMHALAEIARKYANGRIRTAATQNYVLRWVHEDDLPGLHGELVDIGLAEAHALTISDVMTCPGADTCSIGVTSSKGLGTELRNRIAAGNGKYHDDPLVNDIRIKISGCPNSCGQHHVADIGFYGMAIRSGERQVPAFQLLLGGIAEGEGRLGKLTMKIPARYIPDAVEKLVATYVDQRGDGEKFASWSQRVGTPHVQELLAEYKVVPDFNKDPMAYVDWGQSKLFTLDDMGEGECAT